MSTSHVYREMTPSYGGCLPRVGIVVIGSFLASVLVLIYGGLIVVGIVLEVVTHPSFTPEGK